MKNIYISKYWGRISNLFFEVTDPDIGEAPLFMNLVIFLDGQIGPFPKVLFCEFLF